MENNPVYKDNADAEDEEDDALALVEEVTPTAEIEVEAFSFGDLLASSAESAVKEEEKTESVICSHLCLLRGCPSNFFGMHIMRAFTLFMG